MTRIDPPLHPAIVLLPASTPDRRGAIVRTILIFIALAALLLPLALTWHGASTPPVRRRSAVPAMPGRVVPPIEVPEVEPIRIVAVSRDDARAYNASVPFSTLANPAARPFRFTGDDGARARATDCLAAAMLYEAGADPVGQEAVAQVILNRVRHPAFPRTVCGVVFQGSERTTGCQFTFTCDGALARVLPAGFWVQARQLAAAALNGAVYAPVGQSTHYHTDWVVPYWQASLDKVAAVHTHLFFRWTGWWGTPPAFRRSPDPAEPAIAALAPYSPAHAVLPDAVLGPVGEDGQVVAGTAAAPPPVVIPKLDTVQLKGSTVRLADARTGTFVLQLDPAAFPGSYAMSAIATCQKRTACTVYGFLPGDAMPPAIATIQAQPSLATFVYRASPGREEAAWNCARVTRPSVTQCIAGTATP